MNDEVSRNEERWRVIFDNSSVGIALADPTGHFTLANRTYQQMVGYTEKELTKLS